MIMPYKDQLKKEIQQLQSEIANSKTKNLELENRLLKLQLAEMEEDIKEGYENQTLLKG
jgi:hypothetical protein